VVRHEGWSPPGRTPPFLLDSVFVPDPGLPAGLHTSCRTPQFLPDSTLSDGLHTSCRTTLPDSALYAGLPFRPNSALRAGLSSCRTLPLMPEYNLHDGSRPRESLHPLCRSRSFLPDSTVRGLTTPLLPGSALLTPPFVPDCTLPAGLDLSGYTMPFVPYSFRHEKHRHEKHLQERCTSYRTTPLLPDFTIFAGLYPS
jgi:hypothetical protein